jgi:hypothetical protein
MKEFKDFVKEKIDLYYPETLNLFSTAEAYKLGAYDAKDYLDNIKHQIKSLEEKDKIIIDQFTTITELEEVNSSYAKKIHRLDNAVSEWAHKAAMNRADADKLIEVIKKLLITYDLDLIKDTISNYKNNRD